MLGEQSAYAASQSRGKLPGSQTAVRRQLRDSYAALLDLFREFRAFERAGAPDYTAETLARKHRELAGFKSLLASLDARAWPIEQQVEWHIVRAELNGFDF